MILVILSCTLAFNVYGQKAVAPANVIQAFEQKVPTARGVKWEFDREDNLWEASYKIGREKFSAAFSEVGTWVETERNIKFAQLPQPVRATLKSDFFEYEVEEVELIETPGGRFYAVEAELEREGREYVLELHFSPEGKLRKQVDSKENADPKD
jgi:hypothetical protein